MRERIELQDLDLMDRFLFAEATEDPETLELMLEIILGKEVVLEETPQAEKELRKHLWSKKVRLDVLSRDCEGEIYNAEAQAKNTGSLPKRTRYYQGMIDSRLLEVGEIDYNKLGNVNIIMITSFDLFGKGLYKYTFDMTCEEDPGLKLCDGAKRIFLNTKGTDPEGVSQELIDFLHFMEHSDAETARKSKSSKIQKLHEKIDSIKKSEEVGIRYMNSWEEKVMERQEGKEEGRKESQLEIARKMKSDGLPIEMISKYVDLTEEGIRNIEITENK